MAIAETQNSQYYIRHQIPYRNIRKKKMKSEGGGDKVLEAEAEAEAEAGSGEPGESPSSASSIKQQCIIKHRADIHNTYTI